MQCRSFSYTSFIFLCLSAYAYILLFLVFDLVAACAVIAIQVWCNYIFSFVLRHTPARAMWNLPSCKFRDAEYVYTNMISFRVLHIWCQYFFFFWLYSPIWALAASMKLSVSLQLLDLEQSAGLLGRVNSTSQGICLYTNTEKRTHNTNTKHTCPEWDSNPRSQRPSKRRQFRP
jgi:hypothetical protein